MLPTAPPALRATLTPEELDDRHATRASARAGLPAPAAAAARFALALCEVEAGLRPAAQLEHACHHTLYERLAARVHRAGGPVVTTHSLVDTVTQEHTPGLVDAFVLVRRGARVAAVALRLDAAPGHWQVTELQYQPAPERERASGPPTPAANHAPDGSASPPPGAAGQQRAGVLWEHARRPGRPPAHLHPGPRASGALLVVGVAPRAARPPRARPPLAPPSRPAAVPASRLPGLPRRPAGPRPPARPGRPPSAGRAPARAVRAAGRRRP